MAEDTKLTEAKAKTAAKTVEPPADSPGPAGGSAKPQKAAAKPQKAAAAKQKTVRAGGHVIKVDPAPESTLPPKLCSVHGVRYEGDECPGGSHESSGWGVEDDGG